MLLFFCFFLLYFWNIASADNAPIIARRFYDFHEIHAVFTGLHLGKRAFYKVDFHCFSSFSTSQIFKSVTTL